MSFGFSPSKWMSLSRQTPHARSLGRCLGASPRRLARPKEHRLVCLAAQGTTTSPGLGLNEPVLGILSAKTIGVVGILSAKTTGNGVSWASRIIPESRKPFLADSLKGNHSDHRQWSICSYSGNYHSRLRGKVDVGHVVLRCARHAGLKAVADNEPAAAQPRAGWVWLSHQ